MLILSLGHFFTSTGGFAQGADAGAEVSHAAEAPGQHTGGLGEQLAGKGSECVHTEALHQAINKKYAKKSRPILISVLRRCNCWDALDFLWFVIVVVILFVNVNDRLLIIKY